MNRLLIAAITIAAVLLTACGGAEPAADTTEGARGGGPSEVVSDPTMTAGEPAGGGVVAGACALVVEYDGQTYFGATVDDPPATGDDLGEGTFPPCTDTPDVEAEESGEAVQVLALDGVDPQDAVAVEGRTEIFVREGVDPATVLGD